jgi:hypothetical protein
MMDQQTYSHAIRMCSKHINTSLQNRIDVLTEQIIHARKRIGDLDKKLEIFAVPSIEDDIIIDMCNEV